VRRIARLLKVTADDAFGKVMRFWMWIDENCVDGVVDGVVSTDVDGIVGCDGFSEALQTVGWLTFNDKDEIIEIPYFDRHTSESAKKRALKNRRQSKWRENKDVKVDGPASTTESPEKRREEKSNTKGNGNANRVTSAFKPPSLEEVTLYCTERKNTVDARDFIDHYEGGGWFRGKTKIKSWKACIRIWERNALSKTKADTRLQEDFGDY
jgi:hypothetical protein